MIINNTQKIRLDLFPKIINDLINLNKKFNNKDLIITLGKNNLIFEYHRKKYLLFLVEQKNEQYIYLKYKTKIIYQSQYEPTKIKNILENIIFYIIKKEK